MLLDKIKRRVGMLRDPRYIPFFIQRQVKSFGNRERVSQWLASRRPQLTSSQTFATTKIGLSGIHDYGSLLSHNEVRDVAEWLKQRNVTDGYREDWPAFSPESNDRHPECHVAFHSAEDVIMAPHLLALANREDILQTAASFLSCKPTIGYMAAWWSYPTEGAAKQAENFHRDVDDWRFLKLFAYLSDVNEDNGPHVYVQNSAQSQKLAKIGRFQDDEVQQAFGNANILKMTAPAGHGFIENTFGIHKGQPPVKDRRLIFQTVYCMTSLPYGPTKPVASLSEMSAATGMALDPYINRVYLSA